MEDEVFPKVKTRKHKTFSAPIELIEKLEKEAKEQHRSVANLILTILVAHYEGK